LSSEHYQNLDIESFQNIEDLKKLAGESQYLQMVERDEELYLECELYENNKRFVANADRLYQVGSTVYKVFENDVAFTPVENIELLKQAGSLENLDPLIQVKERKNTISRLASIVYPCDVWDSSNKSVGKDRTYMKISLDYVNKLDFTIPQIWLSWEIRPYKKTLGVWFWCTRTCHIEWDVTVCADDGSYYTLAGYKSLNTSYFIDVDKVERPNSPFSTFSLISCDVKGWSNSTWTDKCHLTWLSRK
jgi:hypothetical protein